MKILKKNDFSFFSFLAKILCTFVRIFRLAITYRRLRDLSQKIRLISKSPKMIFKKFSCGWSSIKNSLFYQFPTNMSQAPRIAICPDTVLLFEPRMRHPALRVTAIRKYFENKRFFCTIIEENDENLEKYRIFQFFQFYHFFYEIMQTFVRIFTLAKMNRL